jgi:hypothetical protein
MPRIDFSSGLAIAGLVLAIILIVLDKAGKLKGSVLFVLLGLAALMTLPLVLGAPWVAGAAPAALRFARSMLVICLVGVGYSAIAIWISPETSPLPPAPNPPGAAPIASCKVTAISKSEIFSRVCARGPVPSPGQEEDFEPYLQELFYEWMLNLTPSKDTSDVVVIIHSQTRDENFRVFPQDAVISDWQSHWMSGFREARPPDDYIRIVRFPNLDETQPATITIRKPIRLVRGENKWDAADFPDHLFDITAPGMCCCQQPL